MVETETMIAMFRSVQQIDDGYLVNSVHKQSKINELILSNHTENLQHIYRRKCFMSDVFTEIKDDS
jgi:hypothetical protein